jgi:hypothetical protein
VFASCSLKNCSPLSLRNLSTAKNVKVKKLGTFKLAKVNARKSIDVNTGEEIEIPVHNKLIFVPDNSLADAINTPFVNFETTVLSDDITDEDLKAVDNADAVEDEPEKVEDSNDNEESSGGRRRYSTRGFYHNSAAVLR